MKTQSRYRRSPLLLVEWKDGDLVLLQCDSLRRFRLDADLLNLLSRLDGWVSGEELAVNGEPLPVDQLDHLTDLGIVERAGGEEDGGRPHYWKPLDLAVHRRQNLGSGQVDPEGRHETPPAAFKPLPPGPRTVLPPPTQLPAPLGDVLARRRSVRSYGSRPLDLSEISSLLHHSARVVDVFHDQVLGEHAFRPFPGGGARSELELYVLANAVEDLPRGAHYYDARGHALVQVATATDGHQDRINQWVGDAIGEPTAPPPQVVLLVTAVFARVMWKYPGIGLHLVYQDTGCLYQSLYLVATGLGLAPCAVGAHPELETARWLGLDPLEESQVGCFLVGPRQAE